MRIVWLSSDTVGQGSLGATDRLEGARFLLARGHDVTVVCGAMASDRPFEDVPTVFVPTSYRPFRAWFDLWPGVTRALEAMAEPPDVVVSDFALLPPLMRWVARRGRAGSSAPRVVLDVRTPPVEAGSLRTRVQRARFAITLRRYGGRVDAITAITEGVRDYVDGLVGRPARGIAVWRSGCSWCDNEPDAAGWPPELPQDLRDRFVILYQGTMTPGRGLLESVRAMDLVRREAPEAVLVLLGAGSAVPDLEQAIEQLGLDDHVRMVAPVPHGRVREFVGAADVGLVPLPPVWEWHISSPLKLAEYLCGGLPVVLTDIDAHRFVPADAPFAFWTPDANPGEMARAILAAYADRDALAGLGDSARAWAEPRLGWAPQLAILEEVLVSLENPATAALRRSG